MTIDRIIKENGAIHDRITLSEEEISSIDHCHDILCQRFTERGQEYTERQREMCEWWLQGLLRFEGIERMVDMARNAPFPPEKRCVLAGYADVKEAR